MNLSKKTLIILDDLATYNEQIYEQNNINRIQSTLTCNDFNFCIKDLNKLKNDDLLKLIDMEHNFEITSSSHNNLENIINNYLFKYEYVIYILASKVFSNQYQKALSITHKFNNRLIVINANSIAWNLEFLAIKIRDWLNNGDSIPMILDKVELFKKYNVTICYCSELTGIIQSRIVNNKNLKILNFFKAKTLLEFDQTFKILNSYFIIKNSYIKLIKYINKCFNGLNADDIYKICILNTNNDSIWLQTIKNYLLTTYKIEDNQIIYREFPLIFTYICRKNAYGIQIITNKKKLV